MNYDTCACCLTTICPFEVREGCYNDCAYCGDMLCTGCTRCQGCWEKKLDKIEKGLDKIEKKLDHLDDVGDDYIQYALEILKPLKSDIKNIAEKLYSYNISVNEYQGVYITKKWVDLQDMVGDLLDDLDKLRDELCDRLRPGKLTKSAYKKN